MNRTASVNSSGCDVLVVGGGIHGCSAALHLAMRGVDVVVVEKDFAGRHASGVNAGGVRRLGRDEREIALSDASLKMWQEIGDLVDDDCGFEVKGHAQIAETEAELQGLSARVARLNELGWRHEVLLDRKEMREVVPAAAEHCLGGIFVAQDGAAMPYHTTQAFYRKAAALGVRFQTGGPVTGIEARGSRWSVRTATRTFDAGGLVNCAGAWAVDICEMLSEHAPVQPIAPMLSITAPMDRFVDPVVSAAGRVLSFKQYENGTVLIGGGLTGRVDMQRNRAELDFGKLAVNADTARILFPEAMRKASIVRSWAGIEARMPDDVPVLGPSMRHASLWHSFGYSAHGFQLGPIAGRLVSEMIVDGEPSVDTTALSIGRFRSPSELNRQGDT